LNEKTIKIDGMKIIEKDPPRDYKELDEVDDVW